MAEAIEFEMTPITSNELIDMEIEQYEVVNAVSPTVELEREDDTVHLKIRDINGLHIIDVYDGKKGDTGVSIASVQLNQDYTLTITLTDGTTYTTGSIRGEKGDKGNQGVGIVGARLNSDYTLSIVYTNGGVDTVGPIRGEKGEQGTGGYSIQLSVPTYVFAGTRKAAVVGGSFSTTVRGFIGGVQKAVTLSNLAVPPGLSVVNDGDETAPKLTISVIGTFTGANVQFTATMEGVPFMVSLPVQVELAKSGAVLWTSSRGPITIHGTVFVTVYLTGPEGETPLKNDLILYGTHLYTCTNDASFGQVTVGTPVELKGIQGEPGERGATGIGIDDAGLCVVNGQLCQTYEEA